MPIPTAMAQIREAKKEDTPKILEMYQILFSKWDRIDEADKMDKAWFNKKEATTYIKEEMEHHKYFVAEEDKKIIGYLKCRIKEREPFHEKVGYIDEAYVADEHREKGLGTKLLEKAIEWFKKKKMNWATVSTHAEDPDANAFWKRKGFKDYNLIYKMKI